MKYGVKRFFCVLMMLCMLAGCASPANKGTEETITPTDKPVEEVTPTIQPEQEMTPTPQPTERVATPTPQPVEDESEEPVTAVFVPENTIGNAIVLADKTGAAPVYIDANGPAFAGLRLIAAAVWRQTQVATPLPLGLN